MFVPTLLVARNIEAEKQLRAQGAICSVLEMAYKSEGGPIGLDVDDPSRKLALATIERSMVWSGGRELRVYDRQSAFAHDAYLFIKGPTLEKQWSPRVTFCEAHPNLPSELEGIVSASQRGSAGEMDWSESDNLLALVARASEFCMFACIWNMLQFKPTVISSRGDEFINWMTQTCRTVGVEFRSVPLSEMPEW